jgi:hypothetical protein
MEDYKLRDLRASHTLVGRGTGRPKDKDEVNKREVSECVLRLKFIMNR